MDVLVELLKHNTMMNGRLLDACESLTPEHLATSLEGTYGSIGATLVHIVQGQDSYAHRMFREERPPRLEEDPFPGFAELRTRLAKTDRMLEEAASRAGGADTVVITGDDPEGTWDMASDLLLLQAINHATEHRSQIATILTQLGVEPPDMSGWRFFFDAGHMKDR